MVGKGIVVGIALDMGIGVAAAAGAGVAARVMEEHELQAEEV